MESRAVTHQHDVVRVIALLDDYTLDVFRCRNSIIQVKYIHVPTNNLMCVSTQQLGTVEHAINKTSPHYCSCICGNTYTAGRSECSPPIPHPLCGCSVRLSCIALLLYLHFLTIHSGNTYFFLHGFETTGHLGDILCF